MADGIFAGPPRRTTCDANPLHQFQQPVAFDVNEAFCNVTHIFGAAHIHPDNGVHQGGSLPVHGYRTRPLSRCGYGHDIVRINQPSAQKAF